MNGLIWSIVSKVDQSVLIVINKTSLIIYIKIIWIFTEKYIFVIIFDPWIIYKRCSTNFGQ
jgi:hypothetical protein